MNFGHATYLASISVMTAVALLAEWVVYSALLLKHLRTILALSITAALYFGIIEGFGVRSGAGVFNPQLTLNKFFLGGSLEVYIYGGFSTAAVVCATIIWANYEEQSKPFIKTGISDIKQKFHC